MANPRGQLDYTTLLALAAVGGYAITAALSDLSAVFLLSACDVLMEKYLWQAKINPIDDSEYESIIEMIEEATYQLMSSFAVGQILPLLGVSDNPSLLPMDGSTYAEADYPELWAILPAALKVGSNFVLPNMSDSFVIGTNSDLAIADWIGSNDHILTTSEMPNHAHSYDVAVSITTAAGIEPALASLTNNAPSLTGFEGGGNPHNNIPFSLKAKYYIVAR